MRPRHIGSLTHLERRRENENWTQNVPLCHSDCRAVYGYCNLTLIDASGRLWTSKARPEWEWTSEAEVAANASRSFILEVGLVGSLRVNEWLLDISHFFFLFLQAELCSVKWPHYVGLTSLWDLYPHTQLQRRYSGVICFKHTYLLKYL